MKEYQKALFIIKKSGSAITKENALLQLSITTEDLNFKYLLEQAAHGYHGYIRPGACRRPGDHNWPLDFKEWRAIMFHETEGCHTRLKQYCERMLAQQKPQWQIIAERNGWRKV